MALGKQLTFSLSLPHLQYGDNADLTCRACYRDDLGHLKGPYKCLLLSMCCSPLNLKTQRLLPLSNLKVRRYLPLCKCNKITARTWANLSPFPFFFPEVKSLSMCHSAVVFPGRRNGLKRRWCDTQTDGLGILPKPLMQNGQ